jgi:hypothetical protein
MLHSLPARCTVSYFTVNRSVAMGVYLWTLASMLRGIGFNEYANDVETATCNELYDILTPINVSCRRRHRDIANLAVSIRNSLRDS